MSTVFDTTVIDNACWGAVTGRDRHADGTFYYAERASTVYNRPSCVARPARREDVLTFATTAEAEAAGFRPCHRCRPDQPTLQEQRAEAVVRACRVIDGTNDTPNLGDLADAAGFSRFHFHRVFKATTGVTPHAYMAACRSQRIRDGLRTADTVADAIYAAGFNSNGRFYATAPAILGMTPTSFRAGGAGTHIQNHVGACSMGPVLVAVADRGVCAILLDGEPDVLRWRLRDRFPNADLRPSGRVFAERVDRALSVAELPPAARGVPGDVRAAVLCQRIRAALPDLRVFSVADNEIHGEVASGGV